MAEPKYAPPTKRSVLIAGHQTSISLEPIFWLESVAIVAFGLSWLTKGETILKDEKT